MFRRLLDSEWIVFVGLLGGAAFGFAGYGAVAGLFIGAAVIAAILQGVLKRRDARHDAQPLQAMDEEGEPNLRARIRKIESRVRSLEKTLAAALALIPAAIAYRIATEQLELWPWLASLISFGVWAVAGDALHRHLRSD